MFTEAGSLVTYSVVSQNISRAVVLYGRPHELPPITAGGLHFLNFQYRGQVDSSAA